MFPKVFVDCDGVLADFDAGYEKFFGVRPTKEADDVDWKIVDAHGSFYLDLDPMEDWRTLWLMIQPFNPTVLTGTPYSVKGAATHKRKWVAKLLGPDVPVITCKSVEKSKFCAKGDVLIDDWEKYKRLWVGKGGKFITHTSAYQSSKELMEYMKVAVDHHNKMVMSDQFTNGPDITLTNFQIIEYEHLKKMLYWIKKSNG